MRRESWFVVVGVHSWWLLCSWLWCACGVWLVITIVLV